MFKKITEAHNAFMDNHKARMGEIDQALSFLDSLSDNDDQNEEKLDALSNELEDLLNSL